VNNERQRMLPVPAPKTNLLLDCRKDSF
jgi:hypothetical protein